MTAESQRQEDCWEKKKEFKFVERSNTFFKTELNYGQNCEKYIQLIQVILYAYAHENDKIEKGPFREINNIQYLLIQPYY